MPNDRGQSSLLAQSDLKKYPALSRFLQVSSLQTQTDDPSGGLSSNQALDLLDQAISEAQNQVEAQSSSKRQKEVLNATAEAAPNSLLEAQPGPEVEAQPESQPETALETPTDAEAGAELSQELAEVSKEVQEQREAQDVKDQQVQINNLAQQAQQPKTDVKPVVVLPITEAKQAEGKHKSTKFSLRWLAEWAKKIKKIFSGAVLYKEEVENSADV